MPLGFNDAISSQMSLKIIIISSPLSSLLFLELYVPSGVVLFPSVFLVPFSFMLKAFLICLKLFGCPFTFKDEALKLVKNLMSNVTDWQASFWGDQAWSWHFLRWLHKCQNSEGFAL